MQYRIMTGILVLIDLLIISSTPFLALLIRLDGNISSRYIDIAEACLPVIILVYLISFYLFGMYQRLWRYAGIHDLLVLVGAVTAGTLFSSLYIYLSYPVMPRALYIISWFLNLLGIGVSRLAVRLIQHIKNSIKAHLDTSKQLKRVLIIGAGDAGAMIARELCQRYRLSKELIGFIDDSIYKRNHRLYGAKVLGTQQDIERVVSIYKIEEIIIAMPSIDGKILRKIINSCKATQCSVKTLPGIYELIDGKVSVQQLRDVALEDLLRREPVKLNLKEVGSYISGKRVLVTGAGGSIGSEICRQVAKMSPEVIVLLGKGENSIYEINQELSHKHPQLNLKPIIADIKDERRIQSVFKMFKPQVVFHAAAHKHVPLMEDQPVEAVRNNIFGTRILAETADRYNTEIFVMISTDKAVNPTSVMGATKRIAELVVQKMNTISTTKFTAVRFGNVLGSRGSVVPLFKKQIAQGGPVTVTHPEMKRYFMTIPEATQLVIEAGALVNGGEVFVLDMGSPVKIVDMVKDLIELSGLVPYKDIKIKFTGLRPGEKLFEELLTAEEGTTATRHKKIFKANIKQADFVQLEKELKLLSQIDGALPIKQALARLVPTYKAFHEEIIKAQ